MIEGKPGTKIRNLCLCGLADEGLAGPPYRLDDISSFCEQSEDSIYISFYDMNKIITSRNKYYNRLKFELNKI